jgi:hypothetical protein
MMLNRAVESSKNTIFLHSDDNNCTPNKMDKNAFKKGAFTRLISHRVLVAFLLTLKMYRTAHLQTNGVSRLEYIKCEIGLHNRTCQLDLRHSSDVL